MTPESAFIVAYTSDIEKLTTFWEGMQAEIKQKFGDKLVIALAQIEIHYILETLEPFEEYQFATKREGRGQGVLTYFGVEDIKKFHALVKSFSTFTTEPRKNAWDGIEFLFKDPDGYLFAAYQLD